MKIRFSPDFTYVEIKHDDGSLQLIPVNLLSEEDKQWIYEEMAKSF
jgi:hypothetical protein